MKLSSNDFDGYESDSESSSSGSSEACTEELPQTEAPNVQPDNEQNFAITEEPLAGRNILVPFANSNDAVVPGPSVGQIAFDDPLLPKGGHAEDSTPEPLTVADVVDNSSVAKERVEIAIPAAAPGNVAMASEDTDDLVLVELTSDQEDKVEPGSEVVEPAPEEVDGAPGLAETEAVMPSTGEQLPPETRLRAESNDHHILSSNVPNSENAVATSNDPSPTPMVKGTNAEDTCPGLAPADDADGVSVATNGGRFLYPYLLRLANKCVERVLPRVRGWAVAAYQTFTSFLTWSK
eukprot:Sro321_g116820.2  (293) ;mRNA; r:57933-59078